MLQKEFQDDGLIRRFGWLERLTSVKLENHSSMEDYVENLVSMANDLCEIVIEVIDQSLLMKGLPEYYHHGTAGVRHGADS